MEFFESIFRSRHAAGTTQLTVKLVDEKSCWVALPPSLINRLLDSRATVPLVLQLRAQSSPGGFGWHDTGPWHVAWSGGATTSGGNVIEIPQQLASMAGIADGLTVSVRAVPDVPPAISAVVEPANSDDWEVVELHAAYMEEQLLNQVGIISVGQPFPFWVRNQTLLSLCVSSAEPAALVRLVPGAEVAVAPRPRDRPAANGVGQEAADTPSAGLPPPVWLRIQAADAAALVALERRNSGAADSGGWLGARTCGTTVACMSAHTARSGSLKQGDTVQLSSKDEKVKHKLLLTVALSDDVAPGHVMLAASTVLMLGSAPCRAVRVQPQQPAAGPLPRTLALCPVVPHLTGSATEELDEQDEPDEGSAEALAWVKGLPQASLAALFAAWLAAQASAAGIAEQPVLLQDGSAVTLVQPCTDKRAHFRVKLQRGLLAGGSTAGAPILISPDDVLPAATSGKQAEAAAVAVEIGAAAQVKAPAPDAHAPPCLAARPDWLRSSVAAALRRTLPLLSAAGRAKLAASGLPVPGGILITGASGTGKTAVAAWLADAVSKSPDCRARCVYVDCREVAGDTPQKLRAALEPLLAEGIASMPALVILDSLEAVCPAISAAGDPGAVPPGTDSLAQWLCDTLDALRCPARPPLPVVVCATCKDAAELAEPLRAARRLDAVIPLPVPGPKQREAILTADLAVRGLHLPEAEIQAAAAQMEGYDMADIRALLDRATLAAARRNLALAPRMADDKAAAAAARKLLGGDLAAARTGFTPAAFWGVGRPGDVVGKVKGWEDVGGLEEARTQLREALELPARAPELVAGAPLRLRTGALLYGPPGCGKTHIVKAAAAAAGLRLISVSGPEVLNKYIGASEAAVRDLFRRASAAAPCVLFFDEFDSIAPQRGHDSTGVTDRVVNQLLTELDGVEGLTGVSVVGATSRPDLLDAALLRPGRLDRLLLCDFPDAKERVQIMRALARSLPLEQNVQLSILAAAAEGFSGADLSALLYEAQMAAAHETLAAHTQGQHVAPTITNDHLKAAYDAARPSVSAAEAARLSTVYAKFRSGRDPSWGRERTAQPGQRATMA